MTFHEAQECIESLVSKCKKAEEKIKKWSAQHTLLVRRIEALEIALTLIVKEWDSNKV